MGEEYQLQNPIFANIKDEVCKTTAISWYNLFKTFAVYNF